MKAYTHRRPTRWLLAAALMLLALLTVTSCATPTPEPTPVPTMVPTVAPTAAPKILDVNGKAFSMDDLKAMTQVTVDYTAKDGTTTSYTGVLITDLIKASKSTGTALTFTASDGYGASIAVADLTDKDIVALLDDGSLRSVLPAQSGKLQVKGLVKLRAATEVSGEAAEDAVRVILATTTSTADSGLLAYLLPDFETANNAKVEVVAVGSGQAMAIGKNGDADVLLVHDRPAEDKFVADGWGVNRQDVMYNDYVIVGPESDPAGIKGMTDAAAAFAKIAAAKAVFCSRGDGSGTHSKEKAIWAAASIAPEGDWYLSLGQGMGDTLTVTNEKLGYTLADRGTWLSRMDTLDLLVLLEGDRVLFNPYGVIAVNPDKWPNVKADMATKFIEWITSVETQQKIVDYKHASGQSLFTPDSEAWRAAKASN
jgi:tungstate transport system substrate-binding protein